MFRRTFARLCEDTPLASRITQALERLRAEGSYGAAALVDCGVAPTANTSIRISGNVASVDSIVELSPPNPIPLPALRRCGLRLAHIHACQLRSSHADITNLREVNGVDSVEAIDGVLYCCTNAVVQDEKFATVEYKFHKGSSKGTVVLWGAAVFRLWVPLQMEDD